MNILVFAPHPDDEVLGCGGTIKKHTDAGDNVVVCVVTKGVEPLFKESFIEQTRLEQKQAHSLIGVKETIYLDFPAVMLEEVHRYELNAAIENVIKKIQPKTVYIPHFGDMQKDHSIVSEAIMVAVRPRGDYSVRNVYAYETLSETEWNIPHISNSFIPQKFIDISETIDCKLRAIGLFKSQISDFPNPRSVGAVEALAKLRGSTVGVNSAEAFTVIREIWK